MKMAFKEANPARNLASAARLAAPPLELARGKDLSVQEDLAVGLMNLVSIE